MTITRQDYYIEYEITSADAGRLEFPFSFPVKEASQIYCFDIESIAGKQTETPIPPNRYQVTAAPDGFSAGGTVRLTTALAVGHVLRIERITPLTQLKVFRNQRDIDPAEVEDALDRNVMALQDGAVDPEVVAQLQDDVYNLEANKADKSDPRFTDARTPTAHKTTHAAGGSDAITPASIGAVATTDSRLSNARTPTAHKTTHAAGGSDAITPASIGAVATTDSRLSNARTPTAHKATHLPGGTDALPVASGTQAGLCRGDGTTITNGPGGVLTAVGGGGGGDGTFDHNQLTWESRAVADQHPQSAVTGLEAALAEKAPLASPAFTGAPTAPTASASSNSTRIATTEFVKNQNYAPLASPTFTGAPTAPTPAAADSSTRVATTEFVKNQQYAMQAVGDIRLWPHRVAELPAGWYFCNGGGYSTSSPIGLALAALSETFKSDWGISVSGTTIYLPNLFSGTDGYFLRPVNGSSRLPGNKQGDAIQNITGAIPSWGSYLYAESRTGAFSGSTVDANGSVPAVGSATRLSALVFSAASSGVPTASENRPINIGMTPAIYLGV